MYSACFTGHRKINDSFFNHLAPTQEWINLDNYLQTVVTHFVDNGVDTFYTGMAIGVDQAAADVVAFVRSFKGPTKLIAAIPFPSQPSKWPQASRDNYNRILSLCNSQVVVNEDPYASWKMHARDKFMVDNSHYVIAVWDGREGGGTYYTAKYAIDNGKNVFKIDPLTLRGEWVT